MIRILNIIIIFLTINAFAEKKYTRNYYENGIIQSEGWIENNKKIKFWKFYYKNGKLKKARPFFRRQRN
ncbi:hypothetical protein [Algibacter sp. PT7-4]|uniref:hypothetical protein n=1 Tax=Algibacter ulvanivorans TaxID=3400999 RepID=UPI003AAA25EC